MALFDLLRRWIPTAEPAALAPAEGNVGADSINVGAAQLENNLRQTWKSPDRSNYWAGRRTYYDHEAEALGRNGLARRMLSQRAFDATREGWSVEFAEDALDPEEAAAANKRLKAQQKRLNATAKLRLALTRAEQYGHAIAVIGVDDGVGDLSLPLDMQAVQRVLWIRVYARPEYTIGELSDATSPNFGFPEFYDINDFHRPEVEAFTTGMRGSGGKRIHHTRILGPFHTEDGHSRLDEVGQALEDYFSSQTAASKLLDSFSIAVLKIKGLFGKLGQDARATRGRLAVMQTALSMFGALTLEQGSEDFEYQNRSAAGISDLIGDKGQMLTAFNGIPSMILLGAEPRGFSTGDEIIDQYYATARAEQTDKLEKPLRRLLEILMRSEDGPQLDLSPDTWSIRFNPLRPPSSKELAEIRRGLWTSANQLVEKGVITRAEMRSLIANTEAVPTIELSEEGAEQEASALGVGQMQALVALVTAAYPTGAPPATLRAVLSGALPMLSDLALEIFPDPPEPAPEEEAAVEGSDEITAEEEAAAKWATAEEIAAEFGAITKGQLRKHRASAVRRQEPGRLTWVKPGGAPLYRIDEVRAMFDVLGPDLEEGTEDDPPGTPAV